MSTDDVLNAIRRDLQGSAPAGRRAALKELAKLGPAAAPAMPDLIRALKDSDKDVRWTAAEMAGDIRLADPVLVDALVAAVGDPQPLVGLFAHYALAKLDVSREEHYNALMAATHVDSSAYSAAWALGKLGVQALAAIPRLKELQAHHDDGVRWAAGKALEALAAASATKAPETGLPATELAALFDSASSASGQSLESTLATLEKGGTNIVPILEERLSDGRLSAESGQSFELALQLLTKLGVKGVPTLTRLAQTDKTGARDRVAESLRAIGSEGKSFLINELGSRDAEAQARAIDGIVLIGASAAFSLTLALREADPRVPPAAAAALIRIGPAVLSHVMRGRDSAARDGNANAVHHADMVLAELRQDAEGT